MSQNKRTPHEENENWKTLVKCVRACARISRHSRRVPPLLLCCCRSAPPRRGRVTAAAGGAQTCFRHFATPPAPRATLSPAVTAHA